MSLGNVSLATPTGVLPFLPFASYTETYTMPLVSSTDYPDGRYQARVQALAPRRGWAVVCRTDRAGASGLKTFWDARKANAGPFWAYFKKADYDPTGASASGRVAVRFDGPFQVTIGPGRVDVQFKLVEVS
jgi:hypothetical protein